MSSTKDLDLDLDLVGSQDYIGVYAFIIQTETVHLPCFYISFFDR